MQFLLWLVTWTVVLIALREAFVLRRRPVRKKTAVMAHEPPAAAGPVRGSGRHAALDYGLPRTAPSAYWHAKHERPKELS